MTLVILIFGEIIPKSVAVRNNLWIARWRSSRFIGCPGCFTR